MTILRIAILMLLACAVPYASAADQGDSCRKSKECIGSYVCRDTGSTGDRCIGRGWKGDSCSKEEAGHGSKHCGGSLKCRDTGDEGYRCVGDGQQGELCAKSEAGHGSESCSGNLECRDTGDRTWRCVGRGYQNDLCAQTDAGHESKSCGGNLKCRDTGKSMWHCIGRGQEGDLCSEEEAGKGSWNCGDVMGCGRAPSGPFKDSYICMASNNWMSKIKDGTPINKLTIPGTHDSGTYSYKRAADIVPFVITQDADIRAQLNAGIRFLDIRARAEDVVKPPPLQPQPSNSPVQLQLYHGPVKLPLTFDEVILQCIQFLKENRDETILLSLKNESKTKTEEIILGKDEDFQAAFLNSYRSYKNWFYGGGTPEGATTPIRINTTFPTLGQARGKIILMSRSGLDYALGIDLHIGDNKSGCMNISEHGDCDNAKPSLKLAYEDHYQPKIPYSSKIDFVKSSLQKAQSDLKGNSNTLWVTFTSANSPPYGPEFFAKSNKGSLVHLVDEWLDINGRLMDKMNLEHSPMGIVAMDFPSWGLIRYLIETNNAWK